MGIFQSESIQQKFDFYHSPNIPFQNLLPISRWNYCIHHWPCIPEVPRVPGKGVTILPRPHSQALGQCSTTWSTMSGNNTTPSQGLTSHLSWGALGLPKSRDSLWGFRGDVQHPLHFMTVDGADSTALAMRLPSHLQPWLLPDTTNAATSARSSIQVSTAACSPSTQKDRVRKRVPPNQAVLIHPSKMRQQSRETTQQSIALCGQGEGAWHKLSKTTGKLKEEQGSSSQC